MAIRKPQPPFRPEVRTVNLGTYLGPPASIVPTITSPFVIPPDRPGPGRKGRRVNLGA